MTQSLQSHASPTDLERGGKYLTFRLADEEYGVQILKVREIIGILPITPVPHTTNSVLGVINLRGRIIPIVDLRTAFGMPSREHTEETCIIVVEVASESDALIIGVVVDEVAEVSDIASDNIDPTPPMGQGIDSKCLLGIGKQDNDVIILLDIDRVLSSEDIVSLHEQVAIEG